MSRAVIGSQGELYGTTSLGGALNYGTVYELAPPTSGAAWIETVLHSFNGPDGEDPTTALLIGPDGALYGDTLWSAGGSGITFELYPPSDGGTHWTEEVLSKFTGLNGGNPSGALSVGESGALYGATLYGNGTVYSLTQPTTAGGAWTQITVYKFPGGSGGAQPRGALAVSRNGTIFGSTTYGGTTGSACTTGCGTVYSLTPPAGAGEPWTHTVVYAFNPAGGDGRYPYAGVLLASSGVIYGTTEDGGGGVGTVFSLSPPAVPGTPMTETILHVFGSPGDGSQPAGNLVLASNGVLYGTTLTGGAHGAGTVYQLTPPASPGGTWHETILHSFAVTDGQSPYGLTAGPGGVLYGTTGGGGTSNNGTVFSLAP